MEQEEDRLSNLPKIILHNILSSLPEEDAARTSVLSKAWLETWYTYPILSFCEDKIITEYRMPMNERTPRFCDYVNKRMLRFYDQNLGIKEFKMEIDWFDPHYMSKDVNVWLKLACESGVQVIELSLRRLQGTDRCYVLPASVILAKSLTKLVVKGIIRVDPIFMNYSIKLFSSLTVLSIHVEVGYKKEIEDLISCCPLIEYITLKFCSALNSLSISGLQKLKGVEVSEIHELFIDAPSLENLTYLVDKSKTEKTYMIDYDRCRNLKRLYMEGNYLTDKWFLKHLPKFTLLENLKLINCKVPETIHISSVQLKVLKISDCLYKLKEVSIDAPNLLLCGYCGNSVPIISFLRSSSELEVEVTSWINYVDICNLREVILQNIKPQNVSISLSLSIYTLPEEIRTVLDPLNPMVLESSSRPPSIKHLDIFEVPDDTSLFRSILNILLLSFCPATISISRVFCNDSFIRHFTAALMNGIDDFCFCADRDIKCWWHSLDVKTTMSEQRITDVTVQIGELDPPGQESINFILQD